MASALHIHAICPDWIAVLAGILKGLFVGDPSWSRESISASLEAARAVWIPMGRQIWRFVISRQASANGHFRAGSGQMVLSSRFLPSASLIGRCFFLTRSGAGELQCLYVGWKASFPLAFSIWSVTLPLSCGRGDWSSVFSNLNVEILDVPTPNNLNPELGIQSCACAISAQKLCKLPLFLILFMASMPPWMRDL